MKRIFHGFLTAVVVIAAAACSNPKKAGEKLILGVESENMAMCLKALSQGADPNSTNILGQTALTVAMQNGMRETVIVLLSNNAVPNGEDLAIACKNSDAELAKLLITEGADVASATEDYDALYDAVYEHRTDIVSILLNAGANPDAPYGSLSETPLMCAASRGYMDIVELLIAAGTDPNVRSSMGWTAEVFASNWAHDDIAARIGRYRSMGD